MFQPIEPHMWGRKHKIQCKKIHKIIMEKEYNMKEILSVPHLYHCSFITSTCSTWYVYFSWRQHKRSSKELKSPKEKPSTKNWWELVNKYFRSLDPWRDNSELCVLQSCPEIFYNIKVQSPTEITSIMLLLFVALSFLFSFLLFYQYFLPFTNKEATLQSLFHCLPLREHRLRQYN